MLMIPISNCIEQLFKTGFLIGNPFYFQVKKNVYYIYFLEIYL